MGYKYSIDRKSFSFNPTKIVAVSATYSALTSDDLINGTAGSAFTITLPTIASLVAAGKPFKCYKIVKVDAAANAVTIAPGNGDTINGTTSISTGTTQYNYFVIANNLNNDWVVVDTNVAPA